MCHDQIINRVALVEYGEYCDCLELRVIYGIIKGLGLKRAVAQNRNGRLTFSGNVRVSVFMAWRNIRGRRSKQFTYNR